jgi:hypothetical protein
MLDGYLLSSLPLGDCDHIPDPTKFGSHGRCKMKGFPGTEPEDVIFIHIYYCYDPDASDWESREYEYLSRVVVDGHTRIHYHYTQAEAEKWAFETAQKLIAKRVQNEQQ